MDVDTNACLKSLRNAFHQFKNLPNEDTVRHLEREINVLVGIINHGNDNILKEFSPKNLLHADSMSILVSILNETNMKESLYAASMTLLHGLASSCKIRESLQNTFKLTSTLANFIKQHQGSSDQTIILQCFSLLQQVTYGIKVQNSLGELQMLIKYLVTKILSPESKFTTSCLGSLANICRNNVVVQDYIKGMTNVKAFFKGIASFLSHDNWMHIIYALSILSISLDEPLGEKVFNQKNINQTFLLIFNVLLQGHTVMTCKYSCDLLIDLLKCSRMQKYLANYTDLETHLKDVVMLLETSTTTLGVEATEKILELLIKLCGIPGLTNSLFKKEIRRESRRHTNAGSHDAEGCLLVILNLAAKQESTGHRIQFMAIKLIMTLYCQSDTFSKDNQSSQMLSKLFEVLSTHLSISEETPDDPSILKDSFANARSCIQLVTLLCTREKTNDHFHTKFINTESIAKFMTDICAKFASDLTHVRHASQEYRIEVSSTVIGLLELMFIIRQCKEEEEIYLNLLRSSNLAPFLACSLSSHISDLVLSSIRIIGQAVQMPEFSSQMLCSVIAAINNSRDEEIAILKNQCTIDTSFPVGSNMDVANSAPKWMWPTREAHDNAVTCLANRISSDLEIKDSAKVSEIMDIYEHKLAVVETKESHLQDLLDTKTTALGQADRLIAQYRCRNAQSEAEKTLTENDTETLINFEQTKKNVSVCLKLRSLLLESQKTCEEQSDQIKTHMDELRTLSQKIETLIEENRILKETAIEHEQLKIAHQDQLERLETAQTHLATVEEEQRNLTEMNEMLRKHGDNLKSQYDCSQQQLRDSEQEKQNISQRLKEKEKKFEEMIKKFAQLEEKSKDQGLERQELENKLLTVENELKRSEKSQRELNNKIEALEKQNTGLLVVIEEYEELKVAYQDQNQRLETAKRSLEVAEKENKSLTELNSMLRKQGENLKSKQEGLVQQLKELDKERLTSLQKLKEKEKKHEESLKTITSLKEEVNDQKSERKDVEKKLKNVEKQLKQTEKAKADLNHKVSSLAVLNQKYEKEIKEKDEIIQDLKIQLDKHSQIAAMIHNLSSGKMPGMPSNGLNFSS